MNTFFANIGEKLAYNFPPSCVDISFINRITPAMSEIQFDNDRISNKLARLKPGKAYDSDLITPKEMNLIAKEISYIIANINRMSYKQGKYSTQWKTGRVKFRHKRVSKEDCGNYQPQTLLSIPSKVKESIICDSIDPSPLLNVVLHKNKRPMGIQKRPIL